MLKTSSMQSKFHISVNAKDEAKFEMFSFYSRMMAAKVESYNDHANALSNRQA